MHIAILYCVMDTMYRLLGVGLASPPFRQFLGLQNRTQATAWVLPNALVRARCTQEEEVQAAACYGLFSIITYMHTSIGTSGLFTFFIWALLGSI